MIPKVRAFARMFPCDALLADSGVTGNGIGYGGVDTGGEKDPSAKNVLSIHDVWDD